MDPLRILILDDHLLFAETLAARLSDEPGFVLPMPVDRPADVPAAVEAARPDVLLLDYRLGDSDGVEVLDRVLAAAPDLLVAMLSGHGEPATVVEALRRGARAWVLKSTEVTELIRVVRLVAAGGRWLPPELLSPVLERLLDRGEEPPNVLARLTERERQVLQCTMDGKSRADIARALFLSTNTVRTHTQNLLGKLECHSLLEAVALARRNGMVPTVPAPEAPAAR
ncbi:MAG TPA: response regulator transcription factor [Jatrophihabitans sp.]|nr:response regulator transcription factor [Jatrophihabitans sp.]